MLLLTTLTATRNKKSNEMFFVLKEVANYRRGKQESKDLECCMIYSLLEVKKKKWGFWEWKEKLGTPYLH